MKRFLLVLFLLQVCFGAFAQTEGQPIEILKIKDGTRLYGYLEKQKGSSLYFHTYYAYRKLYSATVNIISDRVPLSSLHSNWLERLNNDIVPSELMDINGDEIMVSEIRSSLYSAIPEEDNGILYNSQRRLIKNVILDKRNTSGIWYWDLNDYWNDDQLINQQYLDIVPLADVDSIDKEVDSSFPFGILDVITFKSKTAAELQEVTGQITSQIPGKSITIFSADDNRNHQILNSDILKQEIQEVDLHLDLFSQAPFLDIIYLKDNEEVIDGIIREKNLAESYVSIQIRSFGSRKLRKVSLNEVASLGRKPNDLYEEQVANYLASIVESSDIPQTKYYLSGVGEISPFSPEMEKSLDNRFYIIKANALDKIVLAPPHSVEYGVVRLTVPDDQGIENYHIVKIRPSKGNDARLSVRDAEDDSTKMKVSRNMGYPEVTAKIESSGSYIIFNSETGVYFLIIVNVQTYA